MGAYDHLSDEEKRKMLSLIEDSWSRTNRGVKASGWQPPHDVVNPGSFSPQDQNLHALPAIDQTKVVTRSLGGAVDSNGEFQFINKRPGDQGVKKVQGAKQMIGAFSGDAQLMNLQPLNQGVTSTSIGTPPIHDVHVANQNLHRAPKQFTAALPRAITVNSGTGRPGTGIPTNVAIK